MTTRTRPTTTPAHASRGPELTRPAATAISAVLAAVLAGLLVAAVTTAAGSGAAVAAVLMPTHVVAARAAVVGTAPPPPSGPIVIVIEDYRYTPTDLTVPAASTVTVQNHDGSRLTLTAVTGLFDTGPIAPGGSATFTAPATPGSYPFRCTILPVMSGTLTVT